MEQVKGTTVKTNLHMNNYIISLCIVLKKEAFVKTS